MTSQKVLKTDNLSKSVNQLDQGKAKPKSLLSLLPSSVTTHRPFSRMKKVVTLGRTRPITISQIKEIHSTAMSPVIANNPKKYQLIYPKNKTNLAIIHLLVDYYLFQASLFLGHPRHLVTC